MLYSRISNQGGRLSSLHCQFVSVTNLLLLYQDASLSAYKPQRKVLFWHSDVQARRLHSALLFLFPEKGGERGDLRLQREVTTILPRTHV